VRAAIADNASTGVTEFTDPQLDDWRNDEVGQLYSRGLFVRSSTRTLVGWTEPTIATAVDGNGNTYVPRYYDLPATFRRVLGVEFVHLTTDEVMWTSNDFTELEEPGKLRIDDIDKGIGYKIRLFGEREYTAVDDTAIKPEVIEVVKLGVVVQALLSELSRRTKAARSQVATRTTDASPGAVASAVVVARTLLRDAETKARRVQALSTFSR
jgi:hypothetical protein